MRLDVNVGGYAYVFDECENLWISNMNYNGLVKCDLKTKEIEYIKKFEGYDIKDTNLHGTAKRVKNKLFFFPLVSNHVHIYDLESDKESSIKIPKENGVTSFFREIYEAEDSFLIFPTYLNGTIWKINISAGTVSKHEMLTHFFSQYTAEEKKDSRITFTNNQMIIALPYRKEILMVDLKSLDKTVIHFEFKYVIQHMVKKDNNLFVTASNTSDIYRINLETGKYTQYVALEQVISDKEKLVPYSDIVVIDKYVLASNYYAKGIFLSEENGRVINFNESLLKEKYIMEKKGYGATFCGIIENEGKIYFVPGRASHLIEYNLEEGDCKSFEFVITKFRDKEMEEIYIKQLLNYQIEGNFSLKDFILVNCSNDKMI